ncbi:nuclear transport factor 2 family protein [Lactobacillus acetotolerans]|uniref:Uncharacterized protein n=2 Tax=Lactobacillus acetotolerans TaxID=1600 RepID=A0A0D6A0Y5_9LACO|nr:nuclear transport factor 2 family protein [Lactobacillus acetotolerans]QGV05278.1 nuclear transport factor 2 family protein [Lactobacillus acetotolerans]BAQ56483.1 conserved hypothetical protein [Lactobacillus acetotolerans]
MSVTKSIKVIKQYFKMWLTKDSRNLEDIFTSNIHYIECYGAEYSGLHEIKQWMSHKFKTQTVFQWDIKNIYHDKNIFTVEWTFSCTENNKNFSFDGVSLITFTGDKIAEIKEFESKKEHYRPYK